VLRVAVLLRQGWRASTRRTRWRSSAIEPLDCLGSHRVSSICSAMLAIVAALLVMPVAAPAETTTLVSGETDSLCINPVSGFPPTVNGVNNFLPLVTPHSGPFPDTGDACGVQSPSRAVDVPPTAPVVVDAWDGVIPGASWVSINSAGEDSSNPPPAYYIYSATFTLCANQVAGANMALAMYADDTAGAFLNGVPIGHIPASEPSTDENFRSPPGPAGGWPFMSATGTAGGFTTGANSLQFVVRDDTTDNVGLEYVATLTASACAAETFGPSGIVQAPPNQKCTSGRSFTIHIRKLAGLTPYRRVAVYLDGHRVDVTRGREITAPVDLRGLPKGRYTVKIVVTTRTGRRITGTRIYHTCASKPLPPTGR
jgi:hypothetical protein